MEILSKQIKVEDNISESAAMVLNNIAQNQNNHEAIVKEGIITVLHSILAFSNDMKLLVKNLVALIAKNKKMEELKKRRVSSWRTYGKESSDVCSYECHPSTHIVRDNNKRRKKQSL